MTGTLKQGLEHRFGDTGPLALPDAVPDVWTRLAGRTSIRKFTGEIVPFETLRALAAIALSTPSKSDLQQRDIVIIQNPDIHRKLVDILTTGPLAQDWIKKAPSLLVICGNNRRQRQVHEMREKPFVNDHLDAFYNPVMDAGIALAGFLMAADAIGLGCCPVSAVRNKPDAVSELLGLPDHVFPAVGIAVGYPAETPASRARLPLSATVHTDRFNESGIQDQITAYDHRRNGLEGIIWSEQKADQYSRPEREAFGAFIKARKFKLD